MKTSLRKREPLLAKPLRGNTHPPKRVSDDRVREDRFYRNFLRIGRGVPGRHLGVRPVTLDCSRCGQPHTRTGQRYCRDCHAAYMREWRKTHPLTEVAREKDMVRSIAGTYKRRGVLVPQPCACGSSDVEMHHPDYDRPLLVVWMCRPCHLNYHVKHEGCPL